MASLTGAVPVIFGEVLFDCFDDGARVIGGAPFNVAWHLQAFGKQPVFVSRVGDDDAGTRARRRMQDWGMRTDFLQEDQEHPTGEVRVTLDDGQPSYDIVIDCAYDFVEGTQLDRIKPEPALIYHGTLGLRRPTTAAALVLLMRYYPSTPVFMDVNLRAPWWEPEVMPALFSHTRWLKINDEEIAELVEQGDTLKDKARWLIETYDMETVIVTRGKQGAFALSADHSEAEVCPEGELQVVDTVGAGDAFASVCILGLLNDWPLDLTLQRALGFASLLVEQRGATIADPAIYHSLQTGW